jgi:MarR family transcriptional regulator, organic hydroperoxide resistance regulator
LRASEIDARIAARGYETQLMPKNKSARRRRRSDLDVAVLRSFRVIFGSVREHFREVQQSCGVSGSQLWMLHEIRRAEGIGVTELAVRLSIHQSTCSLLINKLVRAKYVAKTRSTVDQRRVGLALTKSGLRVLNRAPGPPEGVLPEAISALSAGKVRSLYRDLQAIIGELDIKDEHAADVPLSDL